MSTPLPAETSTLHTLPSLDAYAALATRCEGLTPAEAAARLARYGRNTLHEAARRPLILSFLSNFTHLMALLLWAGGLIGFVAQLPQLGVAIWSVNLINGTFSFWQEYKAERATQALRKLLPTYARVLRGGVEARIDSEELVPGDLLLLAEGDHISADGRLVEAAELRVDQSTFTGESRPVPKTAEATALNGLARAELPNLVFAGTSVVAGTGKALVYATGMRTAFGGIARMTQSVADEPSPLQRELGRMTRIVTFIALGVGVVFFILAVLFAGVDLASGFIFAMGMIVAFVPEGLLPTVTLALALGVQRMAKRHALMKRLSAVETLGSTSVICTDKTGTLTENEMTVRGLWLGGQAYEVSGVGYAPQGTLRAGTTPVALPASGDLRDLLIAAALCNDARLLPPETPGGRWTVLGDPTEAALLVAARKAGVDLAAEARALPRVREIPFDSRRKRMTSIHMLPDRRGRIAFVKGAPSELLPRCTSVLWHEQEVPLGAEERAAIDAANDCYARGGLRVLAVARHRLAPGQPDGDTDDVERNLTFLGLAAMLDPPRPEVADAVERCRHAGIRIIMITGDYGLTAESIARRIGIIQGAQVRILTGAEIERMDEAALQAALDGELLVARAAPEHKLRIVSALQARGQVVAVTGDGVNDAPALKKADIGVAMGLGGTDVAREAADMILTDDNFASIVNAIEEGRAVYANIRKFITYIFTSNIPEAVPFILFALSQGRIPLGLTVMQVLAIDLGTDMLPALALGAEPPERGLMDRPPRKLSDHVISRGLLLRALLYLGPIQGIIAMVAFYARYWGAGYWGAWLDLPASGPLYRSATAMTLAAVVFTQVGNLFAQRSERVSALRIPLFNNRLIWLGIAAELLLIIAIVNVPFLQWIFDTAPIPAWGWAFLVIWIPALLVADEVRTYVVARSRNH